jgi:hypothetical protein
VALAFCTAGAVLGIVVGSFAHSTGSEAYIPGIIGGGVAANLYLRKRGAFPDKKKKN